LLRATRRLRAWADLAALALPALRVRPLRTAFSVAGIAIGIVSYVATVGASAGGRERVVMELRTFGLNSIWIRPVEPAFDATGSAPSIRNTATAMDTDDYRSIVSSNCCPAVQAVSPVLDASQAKVAAGSRTTTLRVLGVGHAYQGLVNDELADGRNLTESDEREGRRVAVLAPDARRSLFGSRVSVLGDAISVGGVTFEVVGMLREKRLDFLNSIGIAAGQKPNDRVLVPFTALQLVDRRADDIDMLHMSSRRPELNALAVDQVKRLLGANHRHASRYSDNSSRSDFEAADRILDNVALAGLVASALSLLVGAIGIANVMGMAVIERTREIGLRKAIGANRLDIAAQFSLEATLVGFLGGATGLCSAYGCIGMARMFTTLPLYPTWPVLVTGLCVATLAGLLAGLAPAMRAASLRPTEALRA
jgi:putative ABC transport system permease protein